MIPSTSGFLTADLQVERQPSKTYKMDLEGNTTRGFTDDLEAMKQVVFKILNTERYVYPIYSWNYGIETMDLYGEPVSWVCPELERRITEALTVYQILILIYLKKVLYMFLLWSILFLETSKQRGR